MTPNVASSDSILQLVVADTMRGDLGKSYNQLEGIVSSLVILGYNIQSM